MPHSTSTMTTCQFHQSWHLLTDLGGLDWKRWLDKEKVGVMGTQMRRIEWDGKDCMQSKQDYIILSKEKKKYKTQGE